MNAHLNALYEAVFLRPAKWEVTITPKCVLVKADGGFYKEFPDLESAISGVEEWLITKIDQAIVRVESDLQNHEKQVKRLRDSLKTLIAARVARKGY